MVPSAMRNSSSPGSPMRKRTSPFRRRRSPKANRSSRSTASSTSWKSGTRRRNSISGRWSITRGPRARPASPPRPSGGPPLQQDAFQSVRALLRRDVGCAAEGLQDDGTLLGGQLVGGEGMLRISHELGKELPVDHHASHEILDRLACHGSVCPTSLSALPEHPGEFEVNREEASLEAACRVAEDRVSLAGRRRPGQAWGPEPASCMVAYPACTAV